MNLFCFLTRLLPRKRQFLFHELFVVAIALSTFLSGTVSAQDSLDIWVYFDSSVCREPRASEISAKAALRRTRTGFNSFRSDNPVCQSVISEVCRQGGYLRTTFPWENAASFRIPQSATTYVGSLAYVNRIEPVRAITQLPTPPGITARAIASASVPDWAFRMIEIPRAQLYLKRTGRGAPGTGVTIGVIDDGFWMQHPALVGASVIGDSDFVNGSKNSETYAGTHGERCMGLIAGRDTAAGYFGAAWNAEFLLARTEIDESETHLEEDLWAAAIVWAEHHGADLVTSSLGYRFGFTDSSDYTYAQMDGKTTIVAKACAGAIARGMVVVVPMGNEASESVDGSRTLVSPADVDGAISVGAVDEQKTIASFSSQGPTADDRMKPDCVAPGEMVAVFDAGSGYALQNGTSFATPLVAGVVALAVQSMPNDPPLHARDRLLASSRFLPSQTIQNNVYGRGLVDAMMAVLGNDRMYLAIEDSEGLPVAGAVVRLLNGDTVGVADSLGTVVPDSSFCVNLPVDVAVSASGISGLIVTVEKNGVGQVIDINGRSSVVVRDQFLVYPSPVRLSRTKQMMIRLASANADDGSRWAFVLRDCSGRIVCCDEAEAVRSAGGIVLQLAIDFNARHILPGAYMLELKSESTVKRKKIILVP